MKFSSNDQSAPIAIEKKSESREPFWSYLQIITANPAHLPQKMCQMGCIGRAV